MLNVTFKQLRAFVVLANELNFSRAAQRLHVTAPTLTAAIKSLEETLQLKLFDRTTRAVTLTDQSVRFLSIARRLIEDLERGITDLGEQVNLQSGSVAIAGASSFLSYVLSPTIKQLSTTHPGIRVRLVEAGTTTVIDDVLNGDADFGITTFHGKHPKLASTHILSDRVSVVCSLDHPLALVDEPISIKELDKHVFIGLTKNNGLRQVIERDQRLPEICRNPAYEVSVVHLIKPLIKAGIGIALLPEMASSAISDHEIVNLPLKASIWRHMHIVTCRGRSLTPAAEHLKAMILIRLQKLKGNKMIAISKILP
jgi:LysR family carnitine catabolism transcriptional activator